MSDCIDLSLLLFYYIVYAEVKHLLGGEPIAESITQSDNLEQTWISPAPRNYCDHIWCKTPFQAHMAMLTR